MVDPELERALVRLDECLRAACAIEARRAERLVGGGAGWEAIAQLTRAPAHELLFDPSSFEFPLVDASERGRLGVPQRVFDLDGLASDLLLVLLAPHVEPRYRTVYTVLQDDPQERVTTERAVLSILGRSPERRRRVLALLHEDGPLVASGLVVSRPGAHAPLSRALDLAPDVSAFLLGLPPPEHVMGARIEWAASQAPVPDVEAHLCIVHGAGDRHAAASQIAAARGLGVAVVSSPSQAALATATALWRVVTLRGAALELDLSILEPADRDTISRHLHGLVSRFGGMVVLSSPVVLPIAAPHHATAAPTFSKRRQMWLDEAARRGHALAAEAAGRLAAAGRLDARAIAEVFDAVVEPSEAELQAALRNLAAGPVRHTAQIDPQRTWSDLVVRDTTREALQRLVYFVQRRDEVSERRGLEARYRLQNGPVALFSGRSGTGKTLAAEVVAREVGRPLHTVDLARLVSKWVGETEKNIDEVLTTAERSGAVLFFDEADALFSKRTEVSTSNDRFANMEIGYLLQRIERHDGLVILATNFLGAVDEAFIRRFHSRIEFPFPEASDRAEIWRLMLPSGVRLADDVHIEPLAERHRLAGGDIKNAALRAIFLAEQEDAPVSQSHLERAVALELLEQGRLARRHVPSRAGAVDHGLLLKEIADRIEARIERGLSAAFLKEIQVVHGAPTKEALSGRRPAVSLALYRMVAAHDDPDAALHAGFIVSAWSNRPEEEHELLGVLFDLLSEPAPLSIEGRTTALTIQESFDFELLHRFWSSHGHPVRASLVIDVRL